MIRAPLAQSIRTPKYSCSRVIKRIYDVSCVKIRSVIQDVTGMVEYHGAYPYFISGLFESLVGEKLLDVFLDDNTSSHSEIVADTPLELMSCTVNRLKMVPFQQKWATSYQNETELIN